MQGQVPSGLNQGTTIKTPLNADNEDNLHGFKRRMERFIWE